jgi:hypothetical protein
MGTRYSPLILSAKTKKQKGDRKMKKHTAHFLFNWLSENGYAWYDLRNAYHRHTGKNVTADDVLEDSTATWRYYLETGY